MTAAADPAVLGAAGFAGAGLAGSAALVALAAFLGALFSALTGSGGAIILSLALAPLIGVAALVPTLSVALLITHIARVAAFRHSIDRRAATLLAAFAVPGCALGALVYAYLPERAIAAVLGVFLLALVVLKRTLASRIAASRLARLGPAGLAGASGLFGVLSGATIGGGVLALPILGAAGLAGAPLVATDAAVGLALQLTKAIVFGGAATLTAELFGLGLLIGLCMIPGVTLAKTLLARMPLNVHGLMIDGVIALGALGFIRQALKG
ncbi:sulfite exporter TauE/SafE family protein [Alsobacter sp. SYSU BS001988]